VPPYSTWGKAPLKAISTRTKHGHVIICIMSGHMEERRGEESEFCRLSFTLCEGETLRGESALLFVLFGLFNKKYYSYFSFQFWFLTHYDTRTLLISALLG